MTKEQIKKEANEILRELNDLHNRLDILQDDTEIASAGCTEEEAEQRQNFDDMAGQILRAKDYISEATSNLEWIV